MDITLVTQNIGRGGIGMDHHPGIPEHLWEGDRWPLLVERLSQITWSDGTTVKPAVVALNEATGWGDQRFGAAAADLGLAPVGICPSVSDTPPALMVDPDQFSSAVAWNTKHGHSSHHGMGIATGRPTKFQADLTLGVGHITPFGPEQAVAETRLLACRTYRHGPLGVMMGDFNYLPLTGCTYAADTMRPYNKANRLIRPKAFYWSPRNKVSRWARDTLEKTFTRPNLAVARAVRDADFHDAAAVMYQRTGDKSFLAWTCPTMRIDWICLSSGLLPALVDYQVLDTPEWAADHHGVAIRLDLTRVDTRSLWEYC